MSDYIKITDYAAKDTLLTGNPAKLVKGSEIGADFDAVAVAVATKANTNSPTLVTPNIGVATATTVNKVTLTAPATGSTLTISDGKTLTASNTLTLAGTDSTTMTFPASSGTVLTAALQNAITNPSNLSVNLGTGALNAGIGTFSGRISSSAGTTSVAAASDAAIYLSAAGNNTKYAGVWYDGSSTYNSFFGRVPSALSGVGEQDALGYVTIAGSTPTLRAKFSSTGLAVTGTAGVTITNANDGLLTLGSATYYGTIRHDASVSGSNIYNVAAASLGGHKFQIGGVDKLTLDASGNLLVGTSSLISNEKLSISTGATTGAFIKVTNSTNVPLALWNSAASGDNIFATFYVDAGTTLRGSIDFNRGGTLTRYNTTSDGTLKNIIGDSDLSKSVEILNSTRIREYSWKDDATNKPQIGVIAQELYETFKGAVSVGGEHEETDAEGNTVTKYRPWAVDKTAFTFHLIAGYQAQQAQIAALESRLAALEAK